MKLQTIIQRNAVRAGWGFIIVLAVFLFSHTTWGHSRSIPVPSLGVAAGFVVDGSSSNPLDSIYDPPESEVRQPKNYRSYVANLLLNILFIVGIISLILLLMHQNRNLRKMNKKIREGEILYRSIVEDQLEIICRFNTQLKITFVNDAFCSMLNKHRDELIGDDLLRLVPSDEHALVYRTLSNLTPGNPVITLEYSFRFPNGASRWHDWTVRAIVGSDNSIKEYQATGRDITDLKNAYAILLRTKEEAEQANRAKSDFLARMSHELRTPLNSVIGFASLLIKNKENNLSGRDINFLNRILSNGKHLLDLINQILDLSKIESGRLDVDENTVYLNQLVWDIVEQMEDQIRAKRIDLYSDIPESLAPIKTDEGKFRQILINLIGNAIKYTEKGSIMVRIVMDEHSRLPIRLDVLDTGIGISAERLPSIFEPFKQGDSTTSRIYGGTGLGLAISKSLCQLLGYRLEAESHLGEGSCFRIVMDAHRNALAHGEIEKSEDINAGLIARSVESKCAQIAGKTVLIIDDEQDACILLQHIVEEFGCNAITASSGREGLELASRHHPDIILMDVLMPEMNGWEVLINLKSDPELSPIPVVIVSIVASDLRGVSLGLVDLVDKPVSPEKLRVILQQNLRRSRGSVLVVEPNDRDQSRIAPILEEECFDVCSAANSEDAVQILHSGVHDLILIDLSLSNQTGITFLEAVRNDSRYDYVPIILILTDDTPVHWKNGAFQIAETIHKGNEFEQDLKKSLTKLFG